MGTDGTDNDAANTGLSRRGFLRLAGIGLVALYVKPTAVLAPEVESKLLRYDLEDDGVVCFYTSANIITMDDINALLRKYYMPVIMEQIFTESPLMRMIRRTAEKT